MLIITVFVVVADDFSYRATGDRTKQSTKTAPVTEPTGPLTSPRVACTVDSASDPGGGASKDADGAAALLGEIDLADSIRVVLSIHVTSRVKENTVVGLHRGHVCLTFV